MNREYKSTSSLDYKFIYKNDKNVNYGCNNKNNNKNEMAIKIIISIRITIIIKIKNSKR